MDRRKFLGRVDRGYLDNENGEDWEIGDYKGI